MGEHHRLRGTDYAPETQEAKRERQSVQNVRVERDPSLPVERRPKYEPAMPAAFLNRKQRREAKALGEENVPPPPPAGGKP